MTSQQKEKKKGKSKLSMTVACAGLQWEIGELSLNSGWVYYIQFHTNILGKGTNLSLLPQSMG